MANKIISNLTPKTSPAAADVLAIEDTEATKKIDYNALADAILNKITSKTYSVAGSTQTLISAIDALNSNLMHLRLDSTIASIPSNSSFNDYKTPGTYVVDSASVMSTLSDKPDTDSGGRLDVFYVVKSNASDADSSKRLVQRYTENYGPVRIWTRYYTGNAGTWTDWLRNPLRSEITSLNNSLATATLACVGGGSSSIPGNDFNEVTYNLVCRYANDSSYVISNAPDFNWGTLYSCIPTDGSNPYGFQMVVSTTNSRIAIRSYVKSSGFTAWKYITPSAS